MIRTYEVSFDPVALEVLEETFDYIRSDSGPGRAEAWLDAMRAGIDRLESSPQAFRVVTHRRGFPIRAKLVISHWVFYLVDDERSRVYIIDIVHTSRDSRLAEYRIP